MVSSSAARSRGLPPNSGEGASCTDVLTTEALFRAYAERVARLILRLGAAPVDVDDLLQDVFLVVARSSDFDGQGTAKPMTWLTAITIRVMANHRRARQRRTQREAPLSEDLPSTNAQPPELIHADQRRNLLLQALDQLPDQQRDLIVLFELEGQSCAEIAECLGTKPSAVHSRLSRARRSLKREIERLQPQRPVSVEDGR